MRSPGSLQRFWFPALFAVSFALAAARGSAVADVVPPELTGYYVSGYTAEGDPVQEASGWLTPAGAFWADSSQLS